MTSPTEVVQKFYSALSRGDVTGVLETLHDQLEWTETERFPYYTGTWRTPQEVHDRLLVPVARDWDNFAATAHEYIADGERLVSLGAYTGKFKLTGKSIKIPFAHAWTVKDGRIARFDMYLDASPVREAMS